MADITRGDGKIIRCQSATANIKFRPKKVEDETEVRDLTLKADGNNNDKTKSENSKLFPLDLTKPDFIFTDSSSTNSTNSYSLTKLKTASKKHLTPSNTVSQPSNSVYEANYKSQTFAIKVVDFEDVTDSVIDGYMEEVKLLEELQDEETIIEMKAYELKENEEDEKQLFVVMEKGENDFQTFLRSTDRSSNLIRYYWESMLNCVKIVHRKNIVHSDLKPANFIFVKSKLKLIDFGIASAIPTDLTSIVKDSQAGTLNYMSPESIQYRSDDNKVHIPLASDIWSLGCILYLMVYGSPPFGHITSQMAKINAILYKDIEFEPTEDEQLLNCMQQCLQRDYQKRPSVAQLLEHQYLRPIEKNPTMSNFTSSMNESTQDSIMVGKIFDEVSKNTPRTASKNVYKMLKAHTICTN
uniref:Protein kinase domain-containing protein n=1 Tax=Panagrolaimus sp. ES5 TaxID=591445 RepID=A0AC34F122_9BILA